MDGWCSCTYCWSVCIFNVNVLAAVTPFLLCCMVSSFHPLPVPSPRAIWGQSSTGSSAEHLSVPSVCGESHICETLPSVSMSSSDSDPVEQLAQWLLGTGMLGKYMMSRTIFPCTRSYPAAAMHEYSSTSPCKPAICRGRGQCCFMGRMLLAIPSPGCVRPVLQQAPAATSCQPSPPRLCLPACILG